MCGRSLRRRSRPQVLSEDGGEELHRAHAQQAAHGVEDGKEGALLGVVGQDGLAGAGAAGLEGIADDPDRIQGHKGGVAQAHRAGGDEGGQTVQHEDAGRHDEVADDHEGPELAKSAVGAVHQRADDGVGNGVEQAHSRDHDRSEDHGQGQHLTAEGSDVGKHQHIVHVRRAVVQREQHQLVGLGAVQARRLCGLFTHLRCPFLQKTAACPPILGDRLPLVLTVAELCGGITSGPLRERYRPYPSWPWTAAMRTGWSGRPSLR